jgi:predicted lactoylglutathione lyase
MTNRVIINLPVKDQNISKNFFTQVGFSLNPELTDEYATCFNIGENTVVALLNESHFKGITNKEVADTSKTAEVLISVGVQSKEEVNTLVDGAVTAGGKELHEPKDLGWIYGRSFADLDGHQWNIFYMDSTKRP